MYSPASPKAIIYDDECPFCVAYTASFVKLGILKPGQRIPFSALSQQEFIGRMDAERQGNEIPLVDLNGGPTLYGIDALIFLLGKKWKLIKWMAAILPVYFFLKHFYAMISYNRRVILAKKFRETECSCAPAFHKGYRRLFIVFAACISVFITALFGIAVSKTTELSFTHPALKMLAICGTGWLLTIAAAILLLKKKALEYTGHLAVLQIIGVLVLLPAILIAPHIGNTGIFFCLFSVLCSSLLMLKGHVRRVRVLSISALWTLAWFLFLQTGACFWIFIFYN